MASKIKVSQLAKEIEKELDGYTKRLTGNVDKAVTKVTNAAVKELKEISPESDKDRNKKYAKGWRKTKQGNGYIIHNKTNYQLTHLLEKGHAKRNGKGRTKEFPHMEPVEQKAIEDLEKEIRKAAEKS